MVPSNRPKIPAFFHLLKIIWQPSSESVKKMTSHGIITVNLTEIDQKLTLGIIKPSDSSWVSLSEKGWQSMPLFVLITEN